MCRRNSVALDTTVDGLFGLSVHVSRYVATKSRRVGTNGLDDSRINVWLGRDPSVAAPRPNVRTRSACVRSNSRAFCLVSSWAGADPLIRVFVPLGAWTTQRYRQ